MTKRNILNLLIISVLVFSGYYIYNTYINPPEKKIRNRFSDNLFMVQHDYAYKVTVQTANGSQSIYLVKNAGNEFDVWEPGNTGNRIYATALMMDSSGVCITSSYAAEPWKNINDIESIKKLFSVQAGVNEDDVEVSGRSIKMSIRPVSMVGTGNASEIECVLYTKGGEQPEELAFIGRKNNEGKLPFKDVDLGSNYPKYREKDRELYVLSIPVYDYSAMMPMKASVTTVTSAGDDDYGTFFSDPPVRLAEGSPVFDSKLNLVGVFTSVSRTGKQYYVSHYVRTFLSPSVIPESVLASYVKQIDSIPTIPTEVEIPTVMEATATNYDIAIPFTSEQGWTILEEKTTQNDGIHPSLDPAVTNFSTSSFTFSGQKARFRIIIEGEGAVDVGLMTEKNGFVQVDYSDKLNKSQTVDLGMLDGSYTMSVLHDNYTKVRIVFERAE